LEGSLHRFGVRVSVAEAADAMLAAAQPGVLADRQTLRAALRVTLIKDRRDDELFDELFTAFFSLRSVAGPASEHGHNHAHDDLADTGELESVAVSEEPSELPQQGHSHGKPADIRDYFRQEDLAQQYNLHQEANKIDLASVTDEIVLSKEGADSVRDSGASVQLETDRLHNPGLPGQLAPATGHRVDTALTVAQQEVLLGWLETADEDLDEQTLAMLRRQLAGIIADLPELLRRYLDKIGSAVVEARVAKGGRTETVDEQERAELEEALRRLAHQLRGARTSRQRNTPRGRVNPGRTMRKNMRYEGIPFQPVTTSRTADKPRLLLLTDVSLSVRATARFTLHLVYGMQSLFTQTRSFAFVDAPVEITELFAEHPLERALGLVFDGLPAGGLLDVDASSDYGATFTQLLSEHSAALDRRTTLVVLGDGRGNGNDARLDTFQEITRRVRETIWLTPESSYSWGLGACDLPRYAEFCDRVQVVADLTGLQRAAQQISAEATGR
jgi:uncharacterized protein with von Willebrand factor type A (vWA) domain